MMTLTFQSRLPDVPAIRIEVEPLSADSDSLMATSPDMRGLYVVKRNIAELMDALPQAVSDLREADAEAQTT